jgi:Uma2 family endonuclease
VSIDLAQVHRMSLDEYHQLIEAGGFDEDARVELIDGLLVDMSPKTREHELAIAWLNRWLILAVDADRFIATVGMPLTLERSEPEPDLIVFAHDARRPYHPATAELVIEVSVSSLRHDLLIKAPLYAAAGVAEYWVVDVEGRRVVRHRDPSGGHYGAVDEVRDVLVASTLELPPLDLSELFAAAFS